jgi:NADH-quinone oxidoreductase subunit L
MDLHKLCIATVLLPLSSCLIIGLFGKYLKNKIISIISIVSIAITLLIAINFLKNINNIILNSTWYYWSVFNNIEFKFGFLLDNINIIMLSMVAVTSLIVHIYSIYYMQKDENYAKFFSCLSFFTFAMYLLILANNFLQVFFGWELMSLASYLLIGFWPNKELANQSALKAFIINHIGDAGLLLGIAAIFTICNSLDYTEIFRLVPRHPELNSFINVITISLFIGVITKSAQMPLHSWLPDAMVAPIPVSALIHSATMVAAGVFLIARISFVFEYSEYCLNIMLIIGSITACFMGVLATIETDIKRILAYSTISQLGFMIVAMGASAYSVGMFHLITHAFFKVVLFLSAGILILASDNTQNINNMHLLKKHLPVTYYSMLIGVLSMSGFPGFAGFFSKSLIIATVELSDLAFAKSAYYLLLFSSWITAFYSFRLLFVIFNKPKLENLNNTIKYQGSKLANIAIIILASFSIMAGFLLINYLLKLNFFVLPEHDVVTDYFKHDFKNIITMLANGFIDPLGLCSMFGIICAVVIYLKKPHLSKIFKKIIQEDFIGANNFLERQYYFNEINKFIIISVKLIAKCFSEIIEVLCIEKLLINNFIKIIARSASLVQKLQTGHLYHYLFVMLSGVLIILLWLFFNIY